MTYFVCTPSFSRITLQNVMCSSIHPIISTLLQDLKLTKHWFSSFQWVPLQEGMNEICATFRPPITIFLMAGALTKCIESLENIHL